MKSPWYFTILMALTLQFAACDQKPGQATDDKVGVDSIERAGLGKEALATQSKHGAITEVTWDDLIPEDYRPERVLAKYQQQLAELPYGDPRAMKLYEKIQAEVNNAPINQELKGKQIKLNGFIAPLEHTGGRISEFLLVPLFWRLHPCTTPSC